MKKTNSNNPVSPSSFDKLKICTPHECYGIKAPENSGPLVKPAPKIDQELIEDAEEQLAIESQVIVHCTFVAGRFGDRIRIWPSTYLFDLDSDHRSALVHVEGVSIYPTWTELSPYQLIEFTLLFEGLPKSCISFDLKEVIPEAGGMYIKGILRNTLDVYEVSC